MTFDIPTLIGFLAYSLVILVVAIDDIRMRFKYRQMFKASLQLSIDKLTLMKKFEELSVKNESQDIEQTEGFLKFISQSRDWAFTYIEDVQLALVEYDNALATKDVILINDTYKKLMDFLPKDDDEA
jgi:hypothetical protein